MFSTSSISRILYRLLPALGMVAICSQSAYAADPVGFIYSVSDFAISGCARDPDTATAIEVHVYEGAIGIVGVANRPCPWSGDPQWINRGFTIQYRRNVNSSSVINAAMINAPSTPGNTVWMNTPGAWHVNHFDRATQTVLVESPNYTIGISKKYGAAIVEYYNKRIDGTTNLVHSDVGAAFQTALFADANIPTGNIPTDGQAVNCAGGTDFRWNPTQAGSHCPSPAWTFTSNPILACSSSLVGGCTGGTVTLGAGQSGWTQFFIRIRNFYYPNAGNITYPYRTYDEVFGYVTYTFTEHHVTIDHQLWRDGAGAGGTNPPPARGAGHSQLPILFATQFSEMIYKKDGEVGSLLATGTTAPEGENVHIDPLNNNDGRWVTMYANPAAGGRDVLMTPGNRLTVAYYTKQHAGVCQPRWFGLHIPTETNAMTRQTLAQNVVFFEAQFPHYIEYRTMVFPYMWNEVMPGYASQLSTLVDSYSGFMPAWECNM
jgi:hypothetical protein